MTDKEWQELVREAKNDGTYSKLTRAIRFFSYMEDTNIMEGAKYLQRRYNKKTIKKWYITF